MEIYSTILARVLFGKLAKINSFEDSIVVAFLTATVDASSPLIFLIDLQSLGLQSFVVGDPVTLRLIG
jgi:hypothetical protein